MPTSYVEILADYTALRAYSGSADVIYVDDNKMSGAFRRDAADTTSTDNSGTIIVSGSVRWKRVYDGPMSAYWFGVVGDGSTPDHVALQAAVNAATNAHLHIPAGCKIVIGATIELFNPITLSFDSVQDGGGQIIIASGQNIWGLWITQPVHLINPNILGSNDASLTSQDLIHIESTNSVTIDGGYLKNGYRLIGIYGECFYCSFRNVTFGNAKGHQFVGIGTTNPGFDFMMTGCRFQETDTSLQHAIYLDQVGSFIMDDIQVSPCYASNAGMTVNSLAPLAGGCVLSNMVLESYVSGVPALQLVGTSAAPIRLLTGTGNNFNGDAAVQIFYAQEVRLTQGYFSGQSHGIYVLNHADQIDVSGSTWECLNTPIACDNGCSRIAVTADNSIYNGGYPFLYLPNISSSNYGLLKVSGDVGSAAPPVQLNNYDSAKTDIRSPGDNYGIKKRKTLTGSLTSGGVTVAHGITNGHTQILSVSAYYKGGSGEAIPLTVLYFDGLNIAVNNGSGTAHYRIHIEYVLENVPW